MNRKCKNVIFSLHSPPLHLALRVCLICGGSLMTTTAATLPPMQTPKRLSPIGCSLDKTFLTPLSTMSPKPKWREIT